MRARTERTDGWPVRAVKTIRHTINKGQNSIILGNTENGNYQANGFRSDEEILFSYIHSKEASEAQEESAEIIDLTEQE